MYFSTSELNPLAHAVSQISFHNPIPAPQAFENLGYTTPAHNQQQSPEQPIQPSVPQWKQQLLEQRARKQQQEKQQVKNIY